MENCAASVSSVAGSARSQRQRETRSNSATNLDWHHGGWKRPLMYCWRWLQQPRTRASRPARAPVVSRHKRMNEASADMAPGTRQPTLFSTTPTTFSPNFLHKHKSHACGKGSVESEPCSDRESACTDHTLQRGRCGSCNHQHAIRAFALQNGWRKSFSIYIYILWCDVVV